LVKEEEMINRRNSLRAKYFYTLITIFVIVFLATAILIISMTSAQEQMSREREALIEKDEVIQNIEDSLIQMMLSARSYYAFGIEDELVIVRENLIELEQYASDFSYHLDTAEDREFHVNIQQFLNTYQNEILPESLSLVRAGDFDQLSDYASNGAKEQVNGFLDYTHEVRLDIRNDLEDQYNESLSNVTMFTYIAIAFGAGIFLISMYIFWGVLRQFISPVESLTTASNKLADGENVELEFVKRNDEIGLLASSFYRMAGNIQAKEEELTAQNEELLSQKQELVEQKEKLERYNGLNHSLSVNLKKQEFITAVFKYVNEIYKVDKSIFMLVNEPVYRAVGMTAETIGRFLETSQEELIVRLKEEKYLLTLRPATQSEQGMSEDPVTAYDYYTGVFNREGEVLAVMAATRVGTSFSEEEMIEIYGLMNRVSLALERSMIYEEMNNSRKLNQDIIDNVNEGILFISPSGDLLQFNKAICQLIDCDHWTSQSAVSKDEWEKDLLSKASNEADLRCFMNEFINEDFHGVKSLIYRTEQNGSAKIINVYGMNVYTDNDRIGTIFVHRDITKEHEVDQLKTELVSTVSHELRTPLSSILGFSELLLKKELKPERQKKYMETIHNEAKRLTNLINDFLDLQRMEAGNQKYNFETCSLDVVIMDVLNNFRHESSHEFIFEDSAAHVKIRADRERIQQVLTNLVSNAVKFSPDGGQVKITLENEDNNLVMQVTDQGIGIPEKELPNLFQKFHRIDGKNRRKIGGTGLGLSIVKEIIAKHQGELKADSVEGNGSVFTVSLPAAEILENRDREPGEIQLQRESAILILEDDTSLALLLSEELKSAGFKVIHHDNPSHAYNSIRENKIRAVIADLMLGEEKSGWELIRMLKEDEATIDIPVIVSTAMDLTQKEMELSGVQEYLIKPYPNDQLIQTVLKVTKSSGKNGQVLYPEAVSTGGK
jgi:signal transduction histidine kinase/CheY-like chemotaxis protein